MCRFPDKLDQKWGRAAAFAIVWIALGCAGSEDPSAGQYLLRVGQRQVTVADFEQALEISKTAYPSAPEGNPELMWVIRRRLLVEMIEELLIFQRADELGLVVTEEEIDKRVEEIRADYPEGAFEQIFLEQALTFQSWRKRTRDRMLLDKVVNADLVARPTPPGPAPANAGAESVNTGPGDDADKRYLRKTASDDLGGPYEKWIRELAGRIQIEINTDLWKKLYES